MSKSKGTAAPVPTKNSKVKSPKAPKPPKPPKAQQLSAEFISDSDDSGDEVALTQKPEKKATKAKTTDKSPVKIGVHRPNGVAAKKQTTTAKAPPAPKPTTTQKDAKAAADTDSSSSKESDNDAMSVDYPEAGKEKEKPEEGGSGGDSESESDSDSSSSDGEAPVTQSKPSREIRPPSRAEPSHTVQFRPPVPYQPPKEFRPINASLNASSNTSKLFSNLEGKQIWHITAPAGVPLSKVTEVALDKASHERSILNHNGIDYSLSPADTSEEANRVVLIPGTGGYKVAPAKIAQTLHLQQVVKLPNLSSDQADPNTGSEAAASITRSTIRAPRPQVKGLKMRYFPSGFGDQDPGILGSSDSEAEQLPPAGLGVSKESHSSHTAEKRGYDALNSADEGVAPKKKHKKSRDADEEQRKKERKARKKEKKGAH